MEAKRQKERSALGWVMTFAGTHRGLYAVSVAVAAVGVVCGIIPYFIMGDMIHRLVEGDRNWQAYLASGLAMAVFWTARVVFHSISTACSHKATFHVLAQLRRMDHVPPRRGSCTSSRNMRSSSRATSALMRSMRSKPAIVPPVWFKNGEGENARFRGKTGVRSERPLSPGTSGKALTARSPPSGSTR